MLTAFEVRQQFLDFFKSKGHQIVASAPIVIKDDPTLLFTNAGMNQFKEFFLGNKPITDRRVADTQKCLRVSGKHNDLEEVGVDTYHHTMFEMLGNWSFGDYFKEEAIAWSWELLTTVYGISKDRLYVTVFKGDEAEGLPMDQEAYDFWKRWIAEDRILLGNKKDNFWEMGDTGPCGPCSEIHVDCRSDEERHIVDGKTLVNADHPQVIEIWNNVFMQFNRMKDGSLELLPAKHVDTGMGLERLVRVLQGKQSNYDTDLFSETIATTVKITGREYDYSDSRQAVAFRVIADHIRAIGFTIADGQLPSNTGAGYVVRRILRRAVRYYYSYLDYKQPLLHQLIPIIAAQFQRVFPELHQQVDLVGRVVREEEEAFLRTLDKGLRKIDDLIANAQAENQSNIAGKAAFELYDTYGFPIDLTRLIASEHGLTVDEPGFEAEMAQQKARSRAATALETDDWVVLREGATRFTGYEMLANSTTVLKYRRVQGKGKEMYQWVLASTPFYAESGGQVGDVGRLQFSNGETIDIVNTKKENDLIVHFTTSLPSEISEEVELYVNPGIRAATSRHHSATHLLHAALRTVLGSHVAQKGSLVNADYLRFDFSHFSKVTDEEIRQIERLVNEKIRENAPVLIQEMSKDDALAKGAMALFGEKYGEKVRVVFMDPDFSIELCGGTHVSYTGELGMFRIRQETAVAAGIRRIEAVAGAPAEGYVEQVFDEMQRINVALKHPKDPVKAIEKMADEYELLRKHADMLEARLLVGVRNEVLTKDEIINGVTLVATLVDVPNADALKRLCQDVRHHLNDSLVALGANIGGKPFVAVAIDESVIEAKGLDASKIIKEYMAPLIKGGGGGQKGLATAGGQELSGLQQAISGVKELL